MQRFFDKKIINTDDKLMFQEDPLLVLKEKLQVQESLVDELLSEVDLTDQLATNIAVNRGDKTAAAVRACEETSRQLNDALHDRVNLDFILLADQYSKSEKYFKLYGDFEVNRNKLLMYLTNLLKLINIDHPETVKSPIMIEAGPISEAMKDMLNVAIESLCELNIENFTRLKSAFVGQYDLIKTRFSGVVSLEQRNVISHLFDSGINQPGFLVSDAIQQTEAMLAELTQRFANLIKCKREHNSRNI